MKASEKEGPFACGLLDLVGTVLPLPELENHPGLRAALETPLASAQDLMDRSVFLKTARGLPPSALPVVYKNLWHARYLEAVFWKIADALSDAPVIPNAFSVKFRRLNPSVVLVNFDRAECSRLDLRFMELEFAISEGPRLKLITPPNVWPRVSPEDEIQGAPGVAGRQKFWSLLDTQGVMRAVLAWRKVAPSLLSSFDFMGSFEGEGPEEAFARTFGEAAGRRFRSHLLQKHLDERLRKEPPEGSPSPRF